MLQHTVVRQAQHTSYNQIYNDIIYFRNGGYPNRWMVYHGNSYQNGWFGRTTISGNLYISNHENPSQHISKAPYRTNPEGPFGERRSTMGRRCKVNSGAKGPGTTTQHISFSLSQNPWQMVGPNKFRINDRKMMITDIIHDTINDDVDAFWTVLWKWVRCLRQMTIYESDSCGDCEILLQPASRNARETSQSTRKSTMTCDGIGGNADWNMIQYDRVSLLCAVNEEFEVMVGTWDPHRNGRMLRSACCNFRSFLRICANEWRMATGFSNHAGFSAAKKELLRRVVRSASWHYFIGRKAYDCCRSVSSIAYHTTCIWCIYIYMCRHAYFAHDFHPQANNKINNRAQDFLNYLELLILRAPHLQTTSPHQPRDPKA